MMEVYNSADPHHDLLIAQWYAQLEGTGEMTKIFATPHTLGSLFAVMQRSVCLFEIDEDGIWFVAWMEPSFAGVFFSVWISMDRRHTRAAYEATLKALAAALAQYQVVLGVTSQEGLLDIHRKLGYTVLCAIPSFWMGRTAYLVMVDGERIRKRIQQLRRRSEWPTELLKWAEVS